MNSGRLGIMSGASELDVANAIFRGENLVLVVKPPTRKQMEKRVGVNVPRILGRFGLSADKSKQVLEVMLTSLEMTSAGRFTFTGECLRSEKMCTCNGAISTWTGRGHIYLTR